MNDLQFKKQLQTSPFSLDDEMLAYIEQHPELKKTVQNARGFDQQIERALDVTVPEGLESRILLNQSYSINNALDESHTSTNDEKMSLETEPSSNVKAAVKTSYWGALGGVAASLIVVLMSFSFWQSLPSLNPLKATDIVAHIMDHIEHDSELMTAFKPPKSEQDLQKLFLAVGASIEQPIAEMSYAGECVINGQKGLHIVLQETDGPVTIIVMPGHQLAAIEAFQASGYQGELLPVKGGIVAIVANSREQVALAHRRFFKAVKFV